MVKTVEKLGYKNFSKKGPNLNKRHQQKLIQFLKFLCFYMIFWTKQKSIKFRVKINFS